MNKEYICDPSLYQWHFFLRWCSHDNDEERNKHTEVFTNVLKEAWKYFKLKPKSDISSLLFLFAPVPPQVSHRIETYIWESDRNRYEMETRILLDSFYIQLGQIFQGELDTKTFNIIKPLSPFSLQKDESHRFYLGGALCFCAQVEETITENRIKTLSKEIIKECIGFSMDIDKQEIIHLPFGFFVLIANAEQQLAVLFYFSSNVKQVQQASRFVHFILPQLFLSLLKVRTLYNEYLSNILPKAQMKEKELDDKLKNAEDYSLKLEVLERLSIEISKTQASYVENLSEVEELLETMKVNLQNICLIMKDDLWGKNWQSAQQQLISNIELHIEQMKSDLRYLRITEKQANLALQSLLTIKGVREIQWERRLALALGIFAAMEFPQVFPELAWWLRICLIGLGGLVVGLIYLWLRSR